MKIGKEIKKVTSPKRQVRKAEPQKEPERIPFNRPMPAIKEPQKIDVTGV